MRTFIKFFAHLINFTLIQDDVLLPPFEKRARLASVAKHFEPTAFVETGSYHGETAAFMASFVPKVISIEIDPKNSEIAACRCAGSSKVRILQGSSETVLPEIVKSLNGRVMFWLDAHYQTGMIRGKRRCPLFDELSIIFAATNIDPIIVVDDARKFIWVNGWPSLRSIKAFVQNKRNDLSFRVSNDMIFIGRFSM